MTTLIIGIGNEYRRDDGAGLVVARKIKTKNMSSVKVIEQSGEGAALMEAWGGADTVVLIDAVQSNGSPGAIYRFDAHAESIPTRFFNYSTHAFGVSEAIGLARVLDQLPPSLIVFGIEGKDFGEGEGLSPEVGRASHDVLDDLKQLITAR